MSLGLSASRTATLGRLLLLGCFSWPRWFLARFSLPGSDDHQESSNFKTPERRRVGGVC